MQASVEDEKGQIQLFLNSVPLLGSLRHEEKLKLVDAFGEEAFAGGFLRTWVNHMHACSLKFLSEAANALRACEVTYCCRVNFAPTDGGPFNVCSPSPRRLWITIKSNTSFTTPFPCPMEPYAWRWSHPNCSHPTV